MEKDTHVNFNSIVKNLNTDIRQSWVRCLNSYQMNPGAIVRPNVLTKSEFQDQEEPLRDLLDLAGPEVRRLFARLSDSDYLVSIASPDGINVFYRCDYHLIGKMESLGVANGANWAEDLQGTNGIGTCLKLQKPLSVVGNDHFFNDIKNLTCSVVPVFGPQGRLECVLNTTTNRPTEKEAQKILLSILSRSALRIENQYFSRHYPHARVVRLSPYDDFADPANELRIAIGDNGEILDASSPITSSLELDLKKVLGRNVAEVLGTKIDLSHGPHPQMVHLDFPTPKLLYAKVDDQIGKVQNTHHRAEIQCNSGTGIVQSALPASIQQSVFREHPSLASELSKAFKVANNGLPIILTGEVGSGREDLARILAAGAGNPQFRAVRCDLEEPDTIARCLTDANLSGTLYLDNADVLPEHLKRAVFRRISNRSESDPSLQLNIILGRLEIPSEERLTSDGIFLTGMELRLPPLREYPNRAAVIEKLFEQETELHNPDQLGLAPETLSLLSDGLWPGNFDQVRLVLRHAIAMCDTSEILPENLPQTSAMAEPAHSASQIHSSEKQTVEFALDLNRWNVSRTAKYLGMSRATLNRKIRLLGISRPPRTAA